MSTSTKPRVWLVAGLGNAEPPADRPAVRDDLMRTWTPTDDGRYATGRHVETWESLHARHDLIEVTAR